MDDRDLLRDYVESGSDAAFAELVRRHLGLVHSTALRLVGDPEMAKDVSQSVFIRLARKATAIREGNALPGWLYRVACCEAADALRSECRRRRRETRAMNLSELQSDPAPAWSAVAPHLDEAIRHLKRLDQDALLLRFFEGQPLAEVGRRLGLTEEAAGKRVSRALDQIRVRFARRGLRVSTSILGLALAAHAAQAAPPGWAATVATTALANSSLAGAASSAAGTLTSLLKILAMTKIQATLVGLLFVAGLATPFLASSNATISTGASPNNRAAPERGSAVQSAGDLPSRPEGRTSGLLPGSAALDRLTAWLLNNDQTNSRRGVRDDELRGRIWALAATDYPRAWRLQDQLHSPRLRTQFQQAILGYWSKLDPQAALTAAESLPEGLARIQAVECVLPAWVEKDPAAALAWIRQSMPENRRDSRLACAIQAMSGTDPQGALAALDELPSGLEREHATLGMVQRWAEQDPAAAARFVGQMPFSTQKARLLWDLSVSWARQDPPAESKWVETLSEPRERVNVIIPSIRGLVGQGRLLEAAEFLKRYAGDFVDNPGEIDNRCLTPIMSTWVGSDPAAAKNWATQLPAGQLRDTALASLISHWSYENPSDSAAFASTLPSGQIQRDGLKCALARWCETDAQGAVDWAAALPSGTARDAAWRGVCDGLALVRPPDAANVVASLPPGELQAHAALSVAEQWAKQDPRSAGAWVAAFPDGQTRDQAARAVFNTWKSRDGQAAATWLQSLPEGTKQALMKH